MEIIALIIGWTIVCIGIKILERVAREMVEEVEKLDAAREY